MKNFSKYATLLMVMAIAISANSQTYKNVQYGNFENWVVRDIEESLIIGGDTKRIYRQGCRHLEDQ